MQKGYIELTLVPGRKEPNHRSEMTTQLLFGESFTILETQEEWLLVRGDFDGYECWIDKKQVKFTDITEKNMSRQHVVLQSVSAEAFTIQTLLGSVLCNYNGARLFNNYGNEWRINEQSGYIIGEKSIKKYAFAYLETPYLWGGRSIFGIDCSGFTQMVFALNGISLKRDAYQQAEQGKTISIQDARMNDLAFFSNQQGRIIHVGIVMENNHIIHASGKVRLDKLDEKGIFNVETNSYTHQLAFLKRIDG